VKGEEEKKYTKREEERKRGRRGRGSM